MTRRIPPDFEERWPEFGWGAAEEFWHAHARQIVRWLEQCGKDRMVARRAAHVAEKRALRARERRKNYRFR